MTWGETRIALAVLSGIVTLGSCDDGAESDGGEPDADTDVDTDADTDADGDVPDPDPASPFAAAELFTSES